ncbi:hypothetical protein Acsp05_51940 [Actinokineospora sp. NBRC 105648]|nr:hypothetical protein Acsp05_51940 [Actinokineospora sp. NBRC 105648]
MALGEVLIGCRSGVSRGWDPMCCGSTAAESGPAPTESGSVGTRGHLDLRHKDWDIGDAASLHSTRVGFIRVSRNSVSVE